MFNLPLPKLLLSDTKLVKKSKKVKTSICIARLIYVTETEPPAVILVTAQPANTALGSDPTTSRRQRQPASRSPPPLLI